MLPSRAFRNTGVPPALRSLITPHASLPASVAVQLRFRLGVLPGSIPSSSATSSNSRASFSTSSSRKDELSKGSTRPTSTRSNEPGLPLSAPSEPQLSSQVQETTTSQPLPERVEPRLSLTFTCTVPNCGERSTHEFSKRAYERGIVLVQCPGCQNRCVAQFSSSIS